MFTPSIKCATVALFATLLTTPAISQNMTPPVALGLSTTSPHPTHLLISPQVGATDHTLAKKQTSAWPATDCTKLQSLGAPAPAWLLSSSPAPSQEALLMLINYQMALSVCQQQEQQKTQKEYQAQHLSLLDQQIKQQQHFYNSSLALFEKQQKTMEQFASQEKSMDIQSEQKLQEMVQLQDLTQSLLNKTLLEILQQQEQLKVQRANLNPQGQYIIQDTSLPPIERTLLRLIEVLEQQTKKTSP